MPLAGQESYPTITTEHVLFVFDDDLLTLIVQPVFESIDSWQYPKSGDGTFSIAIKVRIPTWNVEYRPAIMEVLKNGWMQYCTTFLFSGIILYTVWDYLVSNQIIKSVAYFNIKARGSKNMY